MPHFKTELTNENTPETISKFRNLILNADGILICTPEYVFSIPSGLKGHEELKLIMKTVETKFTQATTLLIQGVKGKISKEGKILNKETKIKLEEFTKSYIKLVNGG
ncbi:MAG: NAD(P)H-dependent oxidoreductase [Saprospiraceae bacterium]